MKTFIFKKRLTLGGVILGAIAGYVYWQMIGCANGTCLISSVWYNSTLYGALLGGLLADSFTLHKFEK